MATTEAATSRNGEGTRERLLTAAGSVFAARGYRGATMREIAERADANLASAHYHFGSKEELYLEVARRQYEEIEARLAVATGGMEDGAPVAREVLERRLALRVRAMLELLLETPGHHGLLMQRELCDPSEALPVIVKRFIEPLRREMDALVHALEPHLSRPNVERCTRSIVGQIYFYVTHRPALLLMLERDRYPRGFEDSIAEHVTRFSLGGIAAVAAAAADGRSKPPRRTTKGSA
jgi:AcrR family transcriptional regulator